MIYPRLKLARNLLCDDGVIFISIDDNEQANLKRLCDEVFGEENFVANVAWEKRYTRSNNAKRFYSLKDGIIVYRKSERLEYIKEERTAKSDSGYSNPDNDPRGAWTTSSYVNPATKEKRRNLVYKIVNPFSNEKVSHPTHAWKHSKESYEQHVEENRLWWGKDGTAQYPRLKIFLAAQTDGLVPIDLWHYKETGTTDDAGLEIKELFGGQAVFDTPKPTKLIKRMLGMATNGNGDEVVLDFFAGSASTAHAVYLKNFEDRGNRRCISVQLPEVTDEKSEAFKAGYKNIAEISKERIRRAGKKIKEDNADKEGIDNLDTGFRVFKIDSSNMVDVHISPDEANPELFDTHIENIKKDRSSEDLLFQVLLDWGVDLSLPIIREDIAGKEVFFVDGNALVACFDDGINEEFVTELATRKPLRVVFRDDGFGSGKDGDSVKINVEQVFKLKSPATDIKVI